MDGLKSSNKKGFTIVEVVMVLAIAGTVFLVVFAAIPRLQSTRRDSQRKADFQQIFVAIEKYINNSEDPTIYTDVRTAFPDASVAPSGNLVTQGYVTEPNGDFSFNDPSTNSNYRHRYVGYVTLLGASTPAGDFRVVDEYRCNPNYPATSPAPWQLIPVAERTKPGLFVLVGVLEKGVFCIDNE